MTAQGLQKHIHTYIRTQVVWKWMLMGPLVHLNSACTHACGCVGPCMDRAVSAVHTQQPALLRPTDVNTTEYFRQRVLTSTWVTGIGTRMWSCRYIPVQDLKVLVYARKLPCLYTVHVDKVEKWKFQPFRSLLQTRCIFQIRMFCTNNKAYQSYRNQTALPVHSECSGVLYLESWIGQLLYTIHFH